MPPASYTGSNNMRPSYLDLAYGWLSGQSAIVGRKVKEELWRYNAKFYVVRYHPRTGVYPPEYIDELNDQQLQAIMNA